MPLYRYAWLILLSPLFACTVIVFGTRLWDLFARRRVAAPEGHEAEGHAEAEGDVSFFQAPGPHGQVLTFEDDEDPKVPRLTTGAKVSGYLAILIMALACLYSWVLLLNTAGVLSIAGPLPSGGMAVLSYDWLVQGTASYLVAFHLDTLAIAMMVVVTTVSLLVQFYSQGYMENSAGYARFFAYLSLFGFSMLTITFAGNFLVMFVGWELVGLSSYLLIGFWINKRAKPEEDRLWPLSMNGTKNNAKEIALMVWAKEGMAIMAGRMFMSILPAKDIIEE